MSINNIKMNDFNGYLEIFIGPMFSGKTSEMVHVYNKFRFLNKSVLSINHSIDKRYSNEMVSTHDKVMIPCNTCSKLFDLFNNDTNTNTLVINDYEIVLINEAQFFEDLEEFVKFLLDKKKYVYLFGLDGDFKQKKFGDILNLIPLCDKVTKLNSLCGICKDGTHGIFSKRITNQEEQVVVGTTNYISVCRKCISN